MEVRRPRPKRRCRAFTSAEACRERERRRRIQPRCPVTLAPVACRVDMNMGTSRCDRAPSGRLSRNLDTCSYMALWLCMASSRASAMKAVSVEGRRCRGACTEFRKTVSTSCTCVRSRKPTCSAGSTARRYVVSTPYAASRVDRRAEDRNMVTRESRPDETNLGRGAPASAKAKPTAGRM